MLPYLVINYEPLRKKPLDEITAADVPRGMDPYDFCARNADGTYLLTRPKNRKGV